jgi:hypothetical protein
MTIKLLVTPLKNHVILFCGTPVAILLKTILDDTIAIPYILCMQGVTWSKTTFLSLTRWESFSCSAVEPRQLITPFETLWVLLEWALA